MFRTPLWFICGCLILTLLGCAAVQREVNYYEACLNDSVCVEQMKQVHDISENSVAPVVGGNGLLVEIVGYLGSLLTGLVLGRKVGKKK
ncbi:MAG: hypothetical protein [Arizlama microvirus]|nr:MAG: hypothetical protein [Arizlama microvirus]